MKALVLHEPHHWEIKDVPQPEPGRGQVLVQVKASGLCTTDYDLITGHMPLLAYPRILGHQAAGTIAAVGEGVTGFRTGDRIVAAIDDICGDCPYCRRGRPNLCQNLQRIGFELDGSHAEYVLVSADSLVPLPESIPFSEASILADAVASMYHALVVRGGMQVGDKVVLYGIGGVGIQGIQIVRLGGADVLVTSRQQPRLDMALELGANRAINPLETDVLEAVDEFTAGQGADLVVDGIGLQDSIQLCVEMLRPGGKVILFGNIEATFTANFADIFAPEKDILGSRANDKEDLMAVTELVAEGKIKSLVAREFPLADFGQALAEIEKGSFVGRAVILP